MPCRSRRLVRKSRARRIVRVVDDLELLIPRVAAVAAAPVLRAKGEEARAPVARDPALAQDLRIGRPDPPWQYDDGGLVGINTAPPSVIVQCCGLNGRAAEQIECARQQHPLPFHSVDELLVFAELDVSAWDLIR
ncbi:hypothetical protein ACFXGA_23735 [Actinosynnema sp. NPDC059335]|uniref:hypothetical protein n=1 Tax=Actinosynnema sp. NPDC059335 TaxID=3346804 RepID=UPI0036700AB4